MVEARSDGDVSDPVPLAALGVSKDFGAGLLPVEGDFVPFVASLLAINLSISATKS